ncbi:MAG: hypothetical protein M0Q91_03020 [Methanoregula sp.]|nr:hypothetical protein [Methanoregula sp.]
MKNHAWGLIREGSVLQQGTKRPSPGTATGCRRRIQVMILQSSDGTASMQGYVSLFLRRAA